MANVKQRPTLNPDLPVKSPTPPFLPKTASKQTVQAGDTGNTTVANNQAAPETELVQESSQLLTQVQSGGGELFESSWQQVASVGGSVLGIAAEQVKNTASSSAQMVTDSLYQNTIGQVILQLFNTLPNQAKKDVAEDICDETKECTVR